MASREPDLEIRRTTPEDLPAIIALAGRSLGWAADERDHRFFAWKHFQNPFGESPGWAGFDGERLVAFRTLLRWAFQRGPTQLKIVRAVDTATDPDYQGRGLFRRLTSIAVETLASEGVDAVFNTPNEQSRPGYLKMGWEVMGRPIIHVRPRSPVTLGRMLRARTAAEKWSEPTSVGEIAADVLAATPIGLPATDRWQTPRTEEYLAWRYCFEPLHYRVIEVRGGICVFRVRMRGALREVAICEWLSEEPDPRALQRLVEDAGDYAVGVGMSFGRHRSLPLPRQGPTVTWRPLARPEIPALPDVRFALGDLELF